MKKIYPQIRALGLNLLDRLTRKRGVAIRFNGLRLRVPGRFYRYFTAGYEQDNFLFLKEKIKPGNTCLDIGAHIGIYAVYMAKYGAHVFSFEPTPSSFVLLKKMVDINGCAGKVILSKQAVAASTGKTSFYLNRSLLSANDTTRIAEANSLVYVDFGKTISKEKIEVDTVSIDDFAEANQLVIDFIKIDAEGAELDVLKGAAKTMKKDRPAGIVSVHVFAFPHKEQTLTAIWQLLQDYQLLILQDKEVIDQIQFLSMTGTDIFDFQFLPRP